MFQQIAEYCIDMYFIHTVIEIHNINQNTMLL